MAKTSLVTQVDLRAGDRLKTVWLDARKDIKVGSEVQLKETGDTWWDIVKVYDTREASDIDKHGWDNNNYDKHVGLFHEQT